jgi:hypothetical protein
MRTSLTTITILVTVIHVAALVVVCAAHLTASAAGSDR